MREEVLRSLLLVDADPVHLLQVLLNLTTNAMDAMADIPAEARRIVIRTTLLGDTVVKVTVSDSGPGIPGESQEEEFDAVSTTKENATTHA